MVLVVLAGLAAFHIIQAVRRRQPDRKCRGLAGPALCPTTVRLLTAVLGGGNDHARLAALQSLSRLGPSARPVRATVQELANDLGESRPVRDAAVRLLQRLDGFQTRA
jgi:hypothetical protein